MRREQQLVETPWRHERDNSVGLNTATRRWLLASDSMTQRLRRASNHHFQVRLLGQTWQYPLRGEARRLGLTMHQLAMVRTVELLCNDRVWVYARTVFPAATLTGKERRLRYLQARSLGDVIFKDPSLQRSEFEIAILQQQHTDYQLATRSHALNNKSLLGRRSVFHLSGKPFLLTELFFPHCVQVFSQ